MVLSPARAAGRRFLGWYLQGRGGSSDQEAQGLRHQRGHGAQGSEQDEPHCIARLRRHPVHDAAVGHREHDLGTQGSSPSCRNGAFHPGLQGVAKNSCLSSDTCPLHTYLEGDVGHGLGQVVGLQAVPVIQVFPKKHSHLQGN